MKLFTQASHKTAMQKKLDCERSTCCQCSATAELPEPTVHADKQPLFKDSPKAQVFHVDLSSGWEKP